MSDRGGMSLLLGSTARCDDASAMQRAIILTLATVVVAAHLSGTGTAHAAGAGLTKTAQNH